jgi:tRNA-(ms[2]io[6]A)-hydroxylase
MGLLADALEDAELARFYRGLLAAEARHHESYVDLARSVGLFAEDEVRARLAELAAHEASVIAQARAEPRLHN